MGISGWIVLAFVLGVIFGRISKGSAAVNSTAGPAGATFGTKAAVGQTAFLPPGFPTPAGDANGSYRITLLNSGQNKITTIKLLRELTRFSLTDAKHLTDVAPQEFMRVTSAEQAQAIARAFQGIADVRIDGPGAINTPGTGTSA